MFICGKKEWVEPFAFVEFYGDMYPIPYEVEKYLEFRFGDWRTEHRYSGDGQVGKLYHKRWENL